MLGVQQLAGIEADQFAVLLLIVRDGHVRESFEAGTEAAFRAASAAGHSPQFSLIPREEADDEVGFAERVRLQDEAFAHASGHSVEGVLRIRLTGLGEAGWSRHATRRHWLGLFNCSRAGTARDE